MQSCNLGSMNTGRVGGVGLVDGGTKSSSARRILAEKSSDSSALKSGNELGTEVVVPNTLSDGERSSSVRGVTLRPRRTRARSSAHVSIEPLARRASLRRLCSLSTRPLLCGWNDVVNWCSIPLSLHSVCHVEEVNCVPRSVMMAEGNPKTDIQCDKNVFHTVSVVISAIGTAIGNLVVLSMIVSIYLQPLDSFSGPTKSRFKTLKRRCGIGICSTKGR